MISRTRCRQGEKSGRRWHRARGWEQEAKCLRRLPKVQTVRAEAQTRGEREGGQRPPAGQAWGSVTDSACGSTSCDLWAAGFLPSHSCAVLFLHVAASHWKWPISQPPHRHLFPLISGITNQGHLGFLNITAELVYTASLESITKWLFLGENVGPTNIQIYI